MGNKNNKIRDELDPVVEALKEAGIKHNDDYDIVGIGDVVESILLTLGVTQESFKNFWNLNECHCTERKKFLNGILHWRNKRKP